MTRRLTDEELFRVGRNERGESDLVPISDDTINRRLDGLESFRRARRFEENRNEDPAETLPLRRTDV